VLERRREDQVKAYSPKWIRRKPAGRAQLGFTLIELLVVIVIMGVLATLGLPAIRGLTRGRAMSAATRQLVDDLALARLRAINSRSTVYVVFAPPDLRPRLEAAATEDFSTRQVLSNLVSAPFASYAILSKRSVGDQPGLERPRYLTDWKELPRGTVIVEEKFQMLPGRRADRIFIGGKLVPRFPALESGKLPFPGSTNFMAVPNFSLPVVAFNAQGQLIYPDSGLPLGRDEVIPVAEGTVFQIRDGSGSVVPEVEIKPASSKTNTWIRVNWLTGRASVEQWTLPP
jgi:prepilin-type N-terminal cleavage/methylation domain-containing protein